MPFDGSGNFTRSYNFVDDKNNGIKIVAARMDGEFNNFSTAMNQVFMRNGLVPLSGNLSMGTNTILGLGDGNVAAPAVRFNTDLTSGLYMPGVGRVALSAGGVNRLEANSTGASITGALGLTGAITAAGLITGGGLTTAGVASVGFLNFPTAPGIIQVAATNRVWIDAAGNVGIGAVPTASLDISRTGTTGVSVFARNAVVTNSMFVDAAAAYLGPTTAHPLSIITSTVERIHVSAAGLIGIGKVPTNGVNLDVNGRGAFIQNAGGPTGAIALRASTGDATPGYIQWTNNANSVHRGHIVIDNSNNMTLAPGAVPALVLTSAGLILDINSRELGTKEIPQNAQTGGYQLANSDRGGHVYCTGGASAVIIPQNATVPMPVGSAITVVNDGSGARALSAAAGVTLKWAGSGTVGSRTLGIGGVATLIKVATDTWFVSGAGIS